MLNENQFDEKCQIIENRQVGQTFFLLKLKSAKNNISITPGQFINIRILDNLVPFLRRPFSIFDFEDGIISILYKVQGAGTKILSDLKKGEYIEALFPLGSGFPNYSGNIWLVAGGVGVAGVNYFFKNYKSKLFVGFKDLIDAEIVKQYKNIEIAIEEKSKKYYYGKVTDLLKLRLKDEKPDYIFSCGPEIMMREVYRISEENGVESYFLLERNMGCGVGACYGCAIKVRIENRIKTRLVCKDGPVFKGEEIIWN